MKKLVALICLTSGCGFLSPGEPPNHEEAAPPDISIRTEDGRAYYKPETDVSDTVEGNVIEEFITVCETETLNRRIEPKQVQSEFITWYYDDVTNTRIITPDDLSDTEYNIFNSTDHLHISKAELYIAAGDNFDFLASVEVFVEDNVVAWGGDWGEKWRAPLKIDGSVDLIPLVKNDELEFKFKLRARSPDRTTYVGADLEFLRFYNCEVRNVVSNL